MADIHTSAEFVRLLDTRFRDVMDKGDELYSSNMIPQMYNVMSSDSAFEEFLDIEALGDIPKFNGSVSYLSFTPGYYRKIEPAEYAGAVSFEKKLMLNKKYPVLDSRTDALAQALARTKEKDAVRPFANAFSSAFDYETSEEGVALCSSSHTTKVAGVSTSTGFDNAGTSALNKTNVAAARLAMRKFRVGNGEYANVNPDCIIVPPSLYDTACETVGYDPRSGATNALDPDNANNTINTVHKMKVVEWQYLEDYDTNNWFMVDTRLMKKFMVWIDRVKSEYNTRMDFNTFAFDASVYSYWGCGPTAWQFIYGNQVS